MSLEASQVRVELGGAAILRDVSLALAPGELRAVLGPNGAGKSTLLKVLSGALTPGRGEVALDGQPLAAWPRKVLARRRAVLPQASVLNFSFRVLDVVRLGRSPHAGPGAPANDLAVSEAAMRQTGVAHLAGRDYTTLSGGEQQRVQFARVLAQIWPHEGSDGAPVGRENRYLLLDEPTASLDLAHQHATLRLARRLAGEGVGVLAILHDPNLAALYADRVSILDRGRIRADGHAETVLTEETLRETFGLPVTVIRHPSRGCPYILPV